MTDMTQVIMDITAEQCEEDAEARLIKSGQMVQVTKLAAKLMLQRDVVTTQEALDDLPIGSVICCETEDVDGVVFTLTNLHGCCSGWHDFDIYINDETGSTAVECGDDWTPAFPALVVKRGLEDDDEFAE
jgi:hypothetical protein